MGEGLTQDMKLYLISCMIQFINSANRKDLKTQEIGEVDSLWHISNFTSAHQSNILLGLVWQIHVTINWIQLIYFLDWRPLHTRSNSVKVKTLLLHLNWTLAAGVEDVTASLLSVCPNCLTLYLSFLCHRRRQKWTSCRHKGCNSIVLQM